MLGFGRRSLVWIAALPLLLAALYLYVSFSRAQASASAPRAGVGDRAALDRECDFPGTGSDHKRLVIIIIDSLRDATALDGRVMPWLSNHQKDALSGRMQPCLSQLSLLCFRTMFEGSEPLLVTGFKNYTGMSVEAPSLIHRLAARGIKVAAVADHAFIGLYQPSLAKHATFEERQPKTMDRDQYGRIRTFEWLGDPSLDVIISHVIDTDATAHRVGVGHAQYVAKFRETDDFLREVSGRLGPKDSLIVLGDHGHDAHGYHSTGIPSVTAYFASGPLFPAGRRHDLHMSALYFLAGAVSCEPTPIGYAGTHPFDDIDWPGGRRQALERATPEVRTAQAPVQSSLGLDVVTLALGVGLFGLLLTALAIPRRLVLGLSAAALGFGLLAGFFSTELLVTLQNHVNPRWTIGFWVAYWVVVAPLSLLASRLLALPRWPALGATAWGVVLFGLFLGPYYYGSLRNLAFGTNVLLLTHVVGSLGGQSWGSRLRSPLVRWTLLAILPTVPLLAPVLTEWQPRWVVLSFSEQLGSVSTAAVALGFFAIGALLAPDRSALRLPGFGALFVFVLGVFTEVPQPVLIASSLVQLSFLGFWRAVKELGAGGLPQRTLLGIGQLSYALVLYFLLLGGLRFANVDFKFALAMTPIDEGELAAALAAIPFVQLKYFLPVVVLLLCGPPLRRETLALALLKVLVLGAALVGMELAAAPSLILFVQLQTQELALTVLIYAVLVLYLAGSLLRERFRAGSRSQAVVEGAAS
ncbi:MAG TPA: hypothetical protein VM686_17165 [Polyangiaceae bacterium]|nr:hypothetical protein [Polyangiaceae bacterium]